jgi:hypothetical protein
LTALPVEAPTTAQAAQAALVDLLDGLRARDYAFITPTPATHRLVSGRRDRARPGDLRDVFGWSLPFDPADIPAALVENLRRAGTLAPAGPLLRSTVRVSSLEGRLHIHSAPTGAADAVFFGPDSYRFVRFIALTLGETPAFDRALDIGVGAGAGALALAARRPAAEVIGVDPNPLALRCLAANSDHQKLAVAGEEGSGMTTRKGVFDLIVANPPYIADPSGRLYRDGGAGRGVELGLSWVDQGVQRLAAGGRFLLYTGSPIADGADPIRNRLLQIASAHHLTLDYEEIDPDVFGGTLNQDAYRGVDRIAAVGAVLTRVR